jgi:hypothetical protein
MKDAKLTIRLPVAELEFAKEYAREHSFSLTALVHRQLMRLRAAETMETPPEVEGIVGLVPTKIDARKEYHERCMRKRQ